MTSSRPRWSNATPTGWTMSGAAANKVICNAGSSTRGASVGAEPARQVEQPRKLNHRDTETQRRTEGQVRHAGCMVTVGVHRLLAAPCLLGVSVPLWFNLGETRMIGSNESGESGWS